MPRPAKTKNVIARSAPEKPPTLFKDGLPITAYAIREDEWDVATWQLAHHTKDIVSKPAEKTVDFFMQLGDYFVRAVAVVIGIAGIYFSCSSISPAQCSGSGAARSSTRCLR